MNRSYFSGSFRNAKYINDCANEDSDQKAYPPSLARFFIVHLMISSFLHMGNKDSDQARQWLRLSLVFAGRIGHKVVVSLKTFTDWLASSVSINLPIFFSIWGNTPGKFVSATHYSYHAFYNVLLSIPLSGV